MGKGTGTITQMKATAKQKQGYQFTSTEVTLADLRAVGRDITELSADVFEFTVQLDPT